jgi:hemin uptake protein HemP
MASTYLDKQCQEWELRRMTIENAVGADGCDEVPHSATADLLTSEALLGGRREVVILHRGNRYVLRVTRQGGLVLNKWGEDDHGRQAKR